MRHLAGRDERWGQLFGVSAFGGPGMSLIIVVYNVVAPSFKPGDGDLFCHVYKCKAKEGLLYKSSLNAFLFQQY